MSEDKKVQWDCPFCPAYFFSEVDLKSHLRSGNHSRGNGYVKGNPKWKQRGKPIKRERKPQSKIYKY